MQVKKASSKSYSKTKPKQGARGAAAHTASSSSSSDQLPATATTTTSDSVHASMAVAERYHLDNHLAEHPLMKVRSTYAYALHCYPKPDLRPHCTHDTCMRIHVYECMDVLRGRCCCAGVYHDHGQVDVVDGKAWPSISSSCTLPGKRGTNHNRLGPSQSATCRNLHPIVPHQLQHQWPALCNHQVPARVCSCLLVSARSLI